MDDRFVSKIRLMCLAGLIGFAGGCDPGNLSRSDADHNPYYQKAKRAMESREFKEAVGLYQKALSVNPQFADAHLEIGLLYDDKLKDPVAAIYHYRQYLELRPDSSKRQVVMDFIERAKLGLASQLPQAPLSEPAELTRLQDLNATLVQENALLQAKVGELEQALASPSQPPLQPSPPPTVPVATVVETPARVAPPPEPAPVRVAQAAPPHPTPRVPAPPSHSVTDSRRGRLHVVQKGDTLQSLALKYYGTRSAWDRIFHANRDQVASKNDLRIGQKLAIP